MSKLDIAALAAYAVMVNRESVEECIILNDVAEKLIPMAVFAMYGLPVEHKTAYDLVSHFLELIRFTGANLLQFVSASNFIGFSTRHFYMLLSYNLDERRFR